MRRSIKKVMAIGLSAAMALSLAAWQPAAAANQPKQQQHHQQILLQHRPAQQQGILRQPLVMQLMK